MNLWLSDATVQAAPTIAAGAFTHTNGNKLKKQEIHEHTLAKARLPIVETKSGFRKKLCLVIMPVIACHCAGRIMLEM